MDAYDRAKKRAQFSSVSGLKDLAFDRRLKRDYNRETITVGDKKYETIIQTSRLNESSDYKKISTKFSTPISVGDVVYWDRLDSYWLIYLQRNTEKNYFLGEMQLAKYEIFWSDEWGNIYSQLACMRNISLDIERYNGYFDVGEGSMELLMTNTPQTKSLKRYSKIKINDIVWEVVGVNDFNIDNVIVFYLREVEGNSNYDTSTQPFGKVAFRKKVETCLDDITEINLNSIIDFNLTIKVNGEFIDDNYTVKCTNCVFQNNRIIFTSPGKATIEINTEKTNITKFIQIDVKEEVSFDSQIYSISGPDTVKTLLSYNFTLIRNINGVSETVNGYWSVEEGADLIDYEVFDDKLVIHVKEYLGQLKISCETKDGFKVNKTIDIKGLF